MKRITGQKGKVFYKGTTIPITWDKLHFVEGKQPAITITMKSVGGFQCDFMPSRSSTSTYKFKKYIGSFINHKWNNAFSGSKSAINFINSVFPRWESLNATQ